MTKGHQLFRAVFIADDVFSLKLGLGIHCMVTFDDNERHIHTSFAAPKENRTVVQLWLDCGREERNVFHPFPHQRTISVALFWGGWVGNYF
jgi:hypothetical protein